VVYLASEFSRLSLRILFRRWYFHCFHAAFFIDTLLAASGQTLAAAGFSQPKAMEADCFSFHWHFFTAITDTFQYHFISYH